MSRDELQAVINRLRAALAASNWHGKFTQEIRTATFEQRAGKIAEPLTEVIDELQKELDKRNKRAHRRTYDPRFYRAPYKDD